MPCPDPQARRDRADGPSAGPQGRRRCGSDRSSGRDVDLSSEVFAGPQPDRAGLQQTQSASAQGGRAYDPAALASDRSRRYRFQPARMQELLSPCRLCSYMTGIRSKLRATVWTLSISSRFAGFATFPKTDSRRKFGTISRNSSIRLPARSECWLAKPVILRPGRGKLATRPVPTGSFTATNMMGTAEVASL